MSRRPTTESGPGALYRWGAFAVRNRGKVLIAWVGFLIVFGVVSMTFKSEFNDAFTIPGADSQSAYDLLTDRFPSEAGDQARIVFQADSGIADAAVQTQIKTLLDTVSTMPHVARVESPLDNPGQINTSDIVPQGNGKVAYATVQFDKAAADVPKADIDSFIAKADAAKTDTVKIELGGAIVEQVEQEQPGGETGLALLAAAVVLFIAFGSVIAMGLPIVIALLGLAAGFLGVFIATNFFDIATFTPGIAAMIGLGVGIDYALFIVTRYREGLHQGTTVEEAVARAMDTAGRAVLFAGVVVVIAVLGLVAAALPFMTAYAVAVALVVGFTIAAATTFLPALLGFVGHRIDKWGVKRFQLTAGESGTSFGTKIGRRIQQKPGLYAALSTAFLLILAIPVFTINLGFTDAGASDTSTHSRRAYDVLASGFGPGFNNPFLVAIEGEGKLDPAFLNTVADAIRKEPGVVSVNPPFTNEAGDVAVISIVPAMSIQDDSAVDLVHHLRDDTLPPLMTGTGDHAYVGGIAATFVDVVQKMIGRTPLFFFIVVGLSFLLLTVVFRSPVIALKAAIMNILSIGAAFGVVVAVFQWGWLSRFIGVDSELPILAFMPMFLFSILFGLSMDYEVFLLSRIREAWVHGRSTSDAVVDGLGVTARVITAAAAIMVVVFLSFVLTPDPIQKEFGVGLAVAIFVDATVVRMILVPATMELLGDWNWWFPSWLERAVPHVNVEGSVRPVGAEAASPAD